MQHLLCCGYFGGNERYSTLYISPLWSIWIYSVPRYTVVPSYIVCVVVLVRTFYQYSHGSNTPRFCLVVVSLQVSWMCRYVHLLPTVEADGTGGVACPSFGQAGCPDRVEGHPCTPILSPAPLSKKTQYHYKKQRSHMRIL
jgi:hypothetical protein